ncbi:MAG: hypothetical protein K2X27_23095, partial [Candidatus Obscuribacterales bacterium]|nr:hypothetical protein [Candidatus Obscuribacterales bacterium]
MKKYSSFLALSIFMLSVSPARSEDMKHYLSVVPATGVGRDINKTAPAAMSKSSPLQKSQAPRSMPEPSPDPSGENPTPSASPDNAPPEAVSSQRSFYS